jgi:thymidylate synthase (FAD)
VLGFRKDDSRRAYDHYEEMLAEDERGPGLARELARMNLPMNVYTQWYWKIDLHNLMHFVRLRADPHAQYEIRVYAEAIGEIMKEWVPVTCAAFEDYRLNAVQFSGPAMACLKRMLAGEEVTQETSGMSKGEWREFRAALEG